MFSTFQKISLFFVLIIAINSCKDETTNNEQPASNKQQPATQKIPTPIFNADSAYEHIKSQVAFGPRVPGSASQKNCAAWLEKEFKKYADTVYVQSVSVKQAVSNKSYPVINIIASFNPQLQKRVLLMSHWDSRPWADEDTKDKDKPIDAADDGASGVAILLEMAAKMKLTKPDIGVDILLVDVEDVGKTEWSDLSYCLGTQYWAKNPHVVGYTAMFGICLDMVGAKGARFPLEGQSKYYAGEVQKEIWDTGNRLGFSDYFSYEQGGAITDDHVVINTEAHIPCVDIIYLQPNGGFGRHWHTHNDNINIIDKATLKAVGQTVMEVVYHQ